MNFIIFASVCHAAQTTIFGLIGRTVLPHHPAQGTHIRQPRRPLPHGTLRTARLRLLQPPYRPHPPRRTGPRQRYSPSYPAYGHHQEYHIYVHDPCIGDFRFLAYYPPQHPITLGEQFLQADTLLFQVRSTPLPLSSSDDEEQLHITTLDSFDPQEEEEPTAAAGDKSRRRKTIKEML